MRNSGNDSPEVAIGIAEKEPRAVRLLADHLGAPVTTGRLRNGLEALLAFPYYLLVCPFTQPGRTARFLENLFEYQRTEKVHSNNQRLVPTVDPEELFPGLFHQEVSLLDLGSRPSGTTFLETYIMVSLIKFLCPLTIFEFGTSEGRTTLQFSLNAPEDATIYSLDLPEDQAATRFPRSYPNESGSRKLPIGGLFRQQVRSGKIRQLLQDSASMDFTPLRGKVDFVFIDGDHGMSYVKSDSENALSMLSPQGVVLWHDFGGRWPDVARYVQKLAASKKLYHLAGTTLVLYKSEAQSDAPVSY
jgi:predicted O-methyltransferase YrrM